MKINFKKYKLIILIIMVGLFLRLYKFQELFMYSHDQDLIGWFVRDILENHHLRLVGQETSSHGVFIGSLFYYSLIPFYLLFNMDPLGGVFFSAALGMVSIFSFYFVGKEVFNKRVGLIASFVYSISFYTVFTDREVAPTTTAMLWTVWFLYGLALIIQKKNRIALPLLGFLIGLIWHINLALLLLIPLILVSLLIEKQKVKIKTLIYSAVLSLFGGASFLIFELRHNFNQLNSIFLGAVTDQNFVEGTGRGLAKLDRVMQLVFKNTTSLFYRTTFGFPTWFVAFILTSVLIHLVLTKRLDKKIALIFVFWQILFLTFFTLNATNLSEYYLNGMNVIWIMVFSLAFSFLTQLREYKVFNIIALGSFAIINIYSIVTIPVNRSGYLEKKEIINFIASDSSAHQYPCISISYIVSPGNDLGYRYLFYLKDLHVNAPSSGSPVYTIVFPHSKVDKIDKSFGALGLILPEYKKYSQDIVNKSCSGQNSNLTDPLFGFPK